MAYLKLSLDSDDRKTKMTSICMDLTWVSPNYTLETSKQKKANAKAKSSLHQLL